MSYRFNIGNQVNVLDAAGQFEFRGVVIMRFAAGQYAPGENLYSVQPRGTRSLRQVVMGVREDRLRLVDKPILAYEQTPDVRPRMILDEA